MNKSCASQRDKHKEDEEEVVIVRQPQQKIRIVKKWVMMRLFRVISQWRSPKHLFFIFLHFLMFTAIEWKIFVINIRYCLMRKYRISSRSSESCRLSYKDKNAEIVRWTRRVRGKNSDFRMTRGEKKLQ